MEAVVPRRDGIYDVFEGDLPTCYVLQVGIAFFFVATFLYSYLAFSGKYDPPPSQAAARRGAYTPAAGAAGAQPDDAPQRTVRWSHKGIAASASEAPIETTPLRRPGDPPQMPWYAGGGRAAKKGKGAAVRPGLSS